MTRDLASSAVPGHHHHLLLAPVNPGLGGHGEDDGPVSGSGHHGPGDPDGLTGLATVSLHHQHTERDSQARGQGHQGGRVVRAHHLHGGGGGCLIGSGRQN